MTSAAPSPDGLWTSSCAMAAQHFFTRCRKYFNVDMMDLAAPGGHHPRRLVDTRRPPVRRRRPTVSHLRLDLLALTIARSSPSPRSRTGSRPGRKRAARRTETEHLNWFLVAHLSGYITADGLYDGPFCILSIVDSRTFERLSQPRPQPRPQQHGPRGVLQPLPGRPEGAG